MRFKELPTPVPDARTWGCKSGPYTFLIMLDEHTTWYSASAKPVGAKQFDGTRMDIGYSFTSFKEAEDACKQWLKLRKN